MKLNLILILISIFTVYGCTQETSELNNNESIILKSNETDMKMCSILKEKNNTKEFAYNMKLDFCPQEKEPIYKITWSIGEAGGFELYYINSTVKETCKCEDVPIFETKDGKKTHCINDKQDECSEIKTTCEEILC